MTLPELIKIVGRLSKVHSKRVFTLKDIAIFTGESPASVAMTLIRAKKNGLVERVGRLWFSLIDPPTIEEIALALRSPSYISFESALYKRGILSQSPRGLLSVATLSRPAKVKTPFGTIEFIHLSKKLFFGFDADLLAVAEKAFLDMAYIRMRRGISVESEVFYTEELDKNVLKKFLKSYPANFQKRMTTRLKAKG